MDFFGDLFVRFRDGYDIKRDDFPPECACDAGSNGFSKETYVRIVDETEGRYLEPEEEVVDVAEASVRMMPGDAGLKPVSKLSLKALQ